MNAKFIVSHMDVQMGPFDEVELKAKWTKGEILPIDYVYDEVKQDWILLAERFSWAGKPAAMMTATPPPIKDVVPRAKRVTVTELPRQPENKLAANLETNSKAKVATEYETKFENESMLDAKTNPSYTPDPTFEFNPDPKHKATAPAFNADASDSPSNKLGNLGSQVNLVNGVGEIDLSSLQPGQREIVLKETQGGTLALKSPLMINVIPAEPSLIEWIVPAHQVAGHEVEIYIRALDPANILCAYYDDKFVLRVQPHGGAPKEIPANMMKGEFRLKLRHTAAEIWKLSLHYAGGRTLTLPADTYLDWQPGPASKLVVDCPTEYTAGHPLKVNIKAVDDFGNLAKNFQGAVVLDVKAS